jgi:ferredoxin
MHSNECTTGITSPQEVGKEKVGQPIVSPLKVELVVDPIACDGRGVCAEILPERIDMDAWGYPVVDDAEIAPALYDHAVRAVRSCPRQALHLVERRC